MDPDLLLANLRTELSLFAGCLAGDLSAPVAHCGDWTLFDLAEHLGRANEWVTVAATEQRGDYQAPAAPRNDPAGLAAWFDRGAAAMLEVLAQDPSREAWTVYPPNTVGFWRRRRCLETLVHRWDAQNALGIESVLDPASAAEGIAEVIDTMVPRQVDLGRTAKLDRAVRLLATDTGGSWTLGPGEPVATVSASAQNLLLMLWRRLPVDAEDIDWDGDVRAAREVLAADALLP
jgi:uncharacterized protein (TIGR03083 family)